MTDMQFTEWLREHAKGYNTPREVPTELVWSRIADDVERIVGGHAASRLDVGAALALRRASGATEALPRRRWWTPVAAGALFAGAVLGGFVLGRFGEAPRPGSTVAPRAVTASQVATTIHTLESARILPAPAPHLGPSAPSS